jgi:hypothetical protein
VNAATTGTTTTTITTTAIATDEDMNMRLPLMMRYACTPSAGLEPGQLADLVVLSDDPLKVSDDKLKRLRSLLTLQAGQIVHNAL